MRKAIIAAAALAAIASSACTGPVLRDPAAAPVITQKHVMGNIWERTEVRAWEGNAQRARDTAAKNADEFCSKTGKGMQPLEQSVSVNQKNQKGTTVRLRFKCVEPADSSIMN
ncbi:MAG: hypothetical protein PUG38_04085 [Sutterellaceae bacterium]|nr:hypothetical protein [Sutterellaceae bacterium]